MTSLVLFTLFYKNKVKYEKLVFTFYMCPILEKVPRPFLYTDPKLCGICHVHQNGHINQPRLFHVILFSFTVTILMFTYYVSKPSHP